MLNKRQNWAGSLHLPVIWVLRNHAIASSKICSQTAFVLVEGRSRPPEGLQR